ncbi:hypothetical protein BH11ACT8_BH11ACT8_18700 [soil metagenome]
MTTDVREAAAQRLVTNLLAGRATVLSGELGMGRTHTVHAVAGMLTAGDPERPVHTVHGADAVTSLPLVP